MIGSENSASLVPRSDSEEDQLNDHANININSPNSPNDDPWRKKTILTLDGGGVKGYSSLLILKELMSRIQVHERELDPTHPAESSAHPRPHRPREFTRSASTRASTLEPNEGNDSTVSEADSRFLPHHYFDYIGGTSTGGFIAIMLGRLLMTVDECLRAYENLADSIFGHPRHVHMRNTLIVRRPKYRHKNLERAIKEIIGENHPSRDCDAVFSQGFSDMCRTIVISWQKHSIAGTRKPYLFRSYRHPRRPTLDPLERNPNDNIDHRIWKVARATSAAPSYFKAIKMSENDKKSKFIDGAFGANNPSEEVYRSVRQLSSNQQGAVSEFVSIGTGKKNGSGGNGFVLPIGYTKEAFRLATESESTHERMLENSGRDIFQYSRFNVEHGLDKIKLDTWKGNKGDQTMDLIRRETMDYLHARDVNRKVDEVARRLVQIRQSRAWEPNSDRWERFCHGVQYFCKEATCPSRERIMIELDDLRHHLRDIHSFTESQIESSLEECKYYPLFEKKT